MLPELDLYLNDWLTSSIEDFEDGYRERFYKISNPRIRTSKQSKRHYQYTVCIELESRDGSRHSYRNYVDARFGVYRMKNKLEESLKRITEDYV